jgi:hypothetical protein
VRNAQEPTLAWLEIRCVVFDYSVVKFRACGGFAYQYHNDEWFLAWLKKVGWDKQAQ